MQINTLIQRGFGSLPGLDRIASSRRTETTDRSRPAPEPLAPRSATTSRATQDQVQFSDAARTAARSAEGLAPNPGAGTPSTTSEHDLTEEQRAEVQQLRQADREVRAHEQAHKAAAGRYGGPISLEFTTGPDGKRYATSGSVPIDSSPVEGDPEATIRKMQQVHAAAVAPADPSPADRNIAASAQRHLNEARHEKLDQQRDTSAKASDEAPRDTNALTPGASSSLPTRTAEPPTHSIGSLRPDSESGRRDAEVVARAPSYSPSGSSTRSESRVGRTLDRLA